MEIHGKIQGTIEGKPSIGNIFKNTKNPPFTMKVDIAGYFGTMEEIDIEEKYRANAIAILYPYLRAIVSTYTSSANVLPIILPAVNINAMLEEQDKKNK